MSVLQTTRLSLLPLNRRQLRLYLDDPATLEKDLGHPVSRGIVTDRVRRAVGMKLSKMAAVEEIHHAWYTYWLLIIKNASFGAGLAGFKGLPDEHGDAEIGYGIDPAFQNKGYMTEAVLALTAWAFREPACLAVIARDVVKSNVASQRVLAKVGMYVYEESGDNLSFRVPRAGPTSARS
ncbi:MAG: GNAT family N-acetyltransferase [Anaerolineales bacterium]|nr:GNAT family N-acetyltransferase [Anaerolineales bacterium]